MTIEFRPTAPFSVLVTCLVGLGCGDVAERQGPVDSASAASVERLKEMTLIPQPLERAAALSNLLDGADASLLPEVQAALKRLSTTRFDGVSSAIAFQYWAKHEPESALAWAKRRAEGAYRDQMLRDAINIWAQRSAQEAVARGWANTVGEDAFTLLEGIIRGWHVSGQEGLDDFVRDLGVSDDQQLAHAVLARLRMDAEGPESLMAWANALQGDRAFKASAVRSVGAVLGGERADLAVKWCDEHCQGAYGGSLRHYIATEWAKHDGEAMMEWLSEAPEHIETDVAIRAGYRGWVMADPEAAYAWVAALSEERKGESRFQPVVGMYIARLSWADSAKALEWTDYLTDPDEQQLARITAVRRWLHRDAEAAEAWLADQTLLDEEAVTKARRVPKNWKTRAVGAQIELE